MSLDSIIDYAGLVLSPPMYVFLAAFCVYRLNAPGTHRRYVAKSVIRPTMWLAFSAQAMWLFDAVAVQQGWLALMIPFYLYNIYWIYQFIKEIRASDEDDWFTGRKKKIRRWLRAKLEVRIPVPVAQGS